MTAKAAQTKVEAMLRQEMATLAAEAAAAEAAANAGACLPALLSMPFVRYGSSVVPLHITTACLIYSKCASLFSRTTARVKELEQTKEEMRLETRLKEEALYSLVLELSAKLQRLQP
eukprot:SAG11_NODE_4589_length_1841_cov_1.169346_1_plen_117_part_00